MFIYYYYTRRYNTTYKDKRFYTQLYNCMLIKMFPDFIQLQNIDKPETITMISGPISYTRFKIFDENNVLLKEIEIFGDQHGTEKNTCVDQGELCLYVTRDGIQGYSNNNCLDVSTYLGYAIFDAHKNKQYTDIYIESRQQEPGRISYTAKRKHKVWDLGYIIKTEAFLRSCGTSINRNSLCRDVSRTSSTLASSRDREGSTSHSTRVSPNNERNWARVHSADIRDDTMYLKFDKALLDSLNVMRFKQDADARLRTTRVLTFLSRESQNFIRAFLYEDVGRGMSELFQPFYEIYPGTKEEQKLYVKDSYPFIDLMMAEFGGYEHTRPTFTSRASKGSLLLIKEDEEGRSTLTHRVGKMYAKVLNMKEHFEINTLPYLMIVAYEKFVLSLGTNVKSPIKLILQKYDDIDAKTSDEYLSQINRMTAAVISKLFVDLYDIYAIGRLISYPESQRIIYYAGDDHSDNLRIYMIHYLAAELAQLKHQSYSIIRDVNILRGNNTTNLNRCMRLSK